jgi:hypothetical protein
MIATAKIEVIPMILFEPTSDDTERKMKYKSKIQLEKLKACALG